MTESEMLHAKKRIVEEREDRARAKQIILHILKEAGGALGKTRLFKAFWLAHLFYAKNSRGYLSAWKIIRLPKGPGIDRGDELIIELKKAGEIELGHEPKGPYTETVCKLTSQPGDTALPPGATEAIKAACAIVMAHDRVSELSEWSHEYSRSWNVTPNGNELDIYSDLIPDDVYWERRQKLIDLNDVYDDLFK
jgi:hypothetical protein